MGQFSSFDELPLIVHDGILRSLASPRDVANTIRASPGSLQAFVTGSRNAVLLATLQECLSLENQHLMNLVMAAPHYYMHGEAHNGLTTSTCVDFEGVSRAGFNQAIYKFLHDFPRLTHLHKTTMRPLTGNTLHCSLKLYTMMEREIRNYTLFTLARSQRRVDNPRLQFDACDQPAPDDGETRRIWRGFLIYELFCVMCGMPQISAAASDEEGRSIERGERFYNQMSAPLREQFLCVHRYMVDQYDLAINEVVESFELALREMGRRSPGPLTNLERSTNPVIALRRDTPPWPVRYLIGQRISGLSTWTEQMAMLGVSVLQELFSWDSTTRLDFIRATYPFLDNCWTQTFSDMVMVKGGMDIRRVVRKRFRWPKPDIKLSDRMRAVGWVFWKNPDRLSSMSLVQGRRGSTSSYWSKNGILPQLKLTVPYSSVQNLLEPQEWEYIIREFGTPSEEGQLDNIKDLFKSVGNLKRAKVAEVVSSSLQQVVESAAAEARIPGPGTT